VVDGHDVTDLLWDSSDERVVGAMVVSRSAPAERREIHADLVVSALGRNNRAGAWLTQHGYDELPQQELRVDIMYAGRLVRIDPSAMGGAALFTFHALRRIARSSGRHKR
jgi:hypothetical protein